MDWLNHNTDKILLFLLVMLCGSLILHMIHHSADTSTIAWAEQTFDTILGALIMVLTGRTSPKTNGNGGTNASPTNQTSVLGITGNSASAK